MVRLALAAPLLLLAACTPELDDQSSLITGPRLLAIASTPAEATPPAQVSFSALYVDQHGDRSADLGWAFCTARKALADEGTVSPACLVAESTDLVPIGSSPAASGALPMDGCRLFGPDPPDAVDGQPAGRPVDPDPSGGFYQPVRLLVRDGKSSYSIGATRIACGINGATPDVAADFARRYVMNENPAVASLEIDGEPIDAGSASVRRGAKVTLRATWAACDPASTTGCTGAEPYVVFDPATRALVSRREAIRVSWFATGGALADDSGGRDESEADQSDVTNTWTAPAASGDARLWVVIRDDRGGVGWREYRVSVL